MKHCAECKSRSFCAIHGCAELADRDATERAAERAAAAGIAAFRKALAEADRKRK